MTPVLALVVLATVCLIGFCAWWVGYSQGYQDKAREVREQKINEARGPR